MLKIIDGSKSAYLMKPSSFSYFEFISAVLDAISHIQLLFFELSFVFSKESE